jgi:hypothetical protein
MTELHDEQVAEPFTVWSADDSLQALWVKAYQGEVLGEILFDGIASHLTDPEQRRKMLVLGTLERRTREAMVPAMERAGLSTEPDPDNVRLAEALANDSATVPWEDLMTSFEPITTQYAAMYERIGQLDPGELATSELLVAHELALRTFGRMELAGGTGDSLHDISVLPHLQ